MCPSLTKSARSSPGFLLRLYRVRSPTTLPPSCGRWCSRVWGRSGWSFRCWIRSGIWDRSGSKTRLVWLLSHAEFRSFWGTGTGRGRCIALRRCRSGSRPLPRCRSASRCGGVEDVCASRSRVKRALCSLPSWTRSSGLRTSAVCKRLRGSWSGRMPCRLPSIHLFQEDVKSNISNLSRHCLYFLKSELLISLYYCNRKTDPLLWFFYVLKGTWPSLSIGHWVLPWVFSLHFPAF